jgi:hypothetical protein
MFQAWDASRASSRSICHGQPLFEQGHVGLAVARPALQLPGQRQQWQPSCRETEQYAGQVHRHRDSCPSNKA